MSPRFVAEHSSRGLANWIHDRMWAHAMIELDEIEQVHLIEVGATREINVGLEFRIRLKRHARPGQSARTRP